ncbi:MAG: cytidine/deoxycytidylate deaminase family protein [Alphaproteobacteria bacterium]|nr:cytidine/deoxycytidylate deaminase family protein [Alphaproteobacteria bacterium]
MSQQYNRPTWDEYFLEVMHALARRATCDRGRTACVIVKDKQIVVSGYVGSPPGLPHCDEVGHLMKKVVEEDGTISEHCMRTIHAEQNAICQAAKRGVSVDGATIYCKLAPCRTCAMLLIASGIKRVVAEYKYHAGGEAEEMLKQAGISVEYIHDETLQYQK